MQLPIDTNFRKQQLYFQDLEAPAVQGRLLHFWLDLHEYQVLLQLLLFCPFHRNFLLTLLP
jgi:hypothetical protein